MSYFASALSMLLDLLFMLVIGLFVIRLLLQWAGASFHNPISQFFYRATNPVLMPLRKPLPTLRGFNTAAALVAWFLATIEIWSISALHGQFLNLASSLAFGLASVVSMMLAIFVGLLFLTVLISLINPGADHSIARLAYQLTEPVLRPIRRRMPDVGPFDFSPLVAFALVALAHLLLVAPLRDIATWLAH